MRRLPDSVERAWERIRDRLPDDPRDRTKLLIAGPVAAICVLWLLFFLISSIDLSGPTRPPNTAAFRTADEISKKLLERQEFNDVGMHVVSERPLKFMVSGAVHSDEDMDALRKFLSEVRPQNDYDMDVVVIP